MTITEFAVALAKYRARYGASVTGGGRTPARSMARKGFVGDPHNWDRAADVVYDGGENRPGAKDHPRLPRSCPACTDFGLKVIHEETHDHLQPMDFPAGPVRDYDGEHREWA